MPAELRWLTAADADAVAAASGMFDAPVAADQARDFLSRDGHHLCIGYLADQPAGFVSGVELNHPDKGTEMLLYELGVDQRWRGRGIGRQLVLALVERARDRGCYGIWTLTELDNDAAIASYRSAGLSDQGSYLMLDQDLG